MSVVSKLDRTMFTEASAAELLGMSSSTLHYWLEGGERRGRSYRPVLRVEPTGTREVTWAEFVEAGLLKQYRTDLRVPMAEMRSFIERLRDTLGLPYPLVHLRPFVADRHLVLQAQVAAGIPGEFCLVAEASGQLLLTPASEGFVHRVRWDDGVASAWRPHRDDQSPVLVDPDVRFGQPQVGGVETDAIWEHLDGGETEDEVAGAFGLTLDQVEWARSYEHSVRSTKLALTG